MSRPARIDQAAPIPTPSRVGQGTAVEMSRAAAEVLAAVQVAQSCPRSIPRAMAEMRQSCEQLGLAERAFYAYPKAGKTVRGPSVHLARELARVWGNIDYGIAELRRDDEDGRQSEMKAFAWDQQTNTRNSSTFIVPHKRDTSNGVVVLTDMREIYENNTNNAARRVREAIFALLPPWFKDEAIRLCQETLKRGENGVRLDQRIESAVQGFRSKSVTVTQLEQRVGRKQAEWTADDVADLGIVYRSIERGELRVDDAFPTERVTVDEIIGQPAAPVAAPAPTPAAVPATPGVHVDPETGEEIPDGVGVMPDEAAAYADGAPS